MVRRGRRAGRARLVVHLLLASSAAQADGARRPVSSGAAEQPDSADHRSREQHEPGPPHAASTSGPGTHTEPTRDVPEPSRVGFVVSKAVGNAVIRHRVTRRLRHLMRDRLGVLPAGTLVVVRALPPAATASSRELGADLDAALRKLRTPRTGGPAAGPR
ncbi:ribonuclease P protein component [Saccharopolyspora sp. SCSIO 74807]|uniref:ribonuclease P protein component n=1 Tax=Saccharopolyspora sp. SCSIO 74807 TaxID=3118084 RepID=UPI00387EB0A1